MNFLRKNIFQFDKWFYRKKITQKKNNNSIAQNSDYMFDIYNKYQIKRIYPVQDIIYEFRASKDLLEKAYEEVLKINFYPNKYNQISISRDEKMKESNDPELNLLNNPKLDDLHKWFTECINLVAKEARYSGEHKIIHSWATKTIKDQSHHQHTHQMSIITGIFYLTTSKEGKGGETYCIYDSRSWDKCFLRHVNFYKHLIKPEAGKLILFPSIVEHGCRPHQDDQPRYTIAFDSFPCGEVANMKKDTISLKINI